MDSTSIGFFAWAPACWLRVTGADASTFLQGQFTNDLRGTVGGSAVYGLWLTVKGKVVADSFILRGADPQEYWVGSYFSPASAIRERLEGFVIADDVVIEDVTADWRALTVFGATSAAPTLAADSGFAFRGRRARAVHVEHVVRASAFDALRMTFVDTPELDADEMERRRIGAGIPAVPADVGPADLPNEGGLEADAISYTKGCYLGQEVMARLKSMGQVRRRVVHVSGAGDAVPRTPAAIFSGERQVGEVRSAVRDTNGGWMGLAMVSLLHVSPGGALSFTANGAPEVRVGEPV